MCLTSFNYGYKTQTSGYNLLSLQTRVTARGCKDKRTILENCMTLSNAVRG